MSRQAGSVPIKHKTGAPTVFDSIYFSPNTGWTKIHAGCIYLNLKQKWPSICSFGDG